MMKYRAEIDGLRAVAVVPVILFHAGFAWFGGGFVGVDIFFVISGYLITTILLGELETGRFSIVRFYERRARRILPALFLVLLVSCVLSLFVLAPVDMKNFAQSLIAVQFFVSNMFFWKTSGYFDTSAELKPLLHTWSLAVEEQYYFFFPVLLAALWRLGRKKLILILAVIAVASLGVADWAASVKPVATFYLLPTRAWELLIGVLVAFQVATLRQEDGLAKGWIAEVGGLSGVALILYSIFCFDDKIPFPSFYALVPTVGAALVIRFSSALTMAGRLLSHPLCAGIGLISYSAYLWHQPLFALYRNYNLADHRVLPYAVLVVFVFALSYVSWRYVEQPFRTAYFDRTRIFVLSAAGIVLFVVIGAIAQMTDGFEARFSPAQKELLSYMEYGKKSPPWSGDCFLLDGEDRSAFARKCSARPLSGGVLMWGDSHAQALANGLAKIDPKLIQFTASGCPPVLYVHFRSRPHCQAINDYVASELRRIRPHLVILDAHWYSYKQVVQESDISSTLRSIRDMLPQARVILVGQAPIWSVNLPFYMFRMGVALDGEHALPNDMLPDIVRINTRLQALAYGAGVDFFSPLDILCLDDNRCKVSVPFDGRFMPSAWDYGHLTVGAAFAVAHQMMPVPRGNPAADLRVD